MGLIVDVKPVFAETADSCVSYLTPRGSADNLSPNTVGEELDQAIAKVDIETSPSPMTIAIQTLEGAKVLLQKAKDHGFFTKSKFEHLMDDLTELEAVLNKKTQNESFNYLMKQWAQFLQDLNLQFDQYLKLGPAGQKTYFTKMQMPLVFMSSHFVTFLETSHLKFKYQRMNQVLKAMNSKNASQDITLYLYQFEKQILKFFSLKEFLSCKA